MFHVYFKGVQVFLKHNLETEWKSKVLSDSHKHLINYICPRVALKQEWQKEKSCQDIHSIQTMIALK